MMAHQHNLEAVGNPTENSNESLSTIFTRGILKENNVLVNLLGLCPAIAVTQTFENGLGMGILVILVLLLTNVSISALRKVISDVVRIPCFIVIIASEVTVIYLLTKAFLPDLAANLGVFIPLITVNCIVFGRAEAFAYKNKVLPSALDGIGAGLGGLVALSLMGFIREVLATGMWTIIGVTIPVGKVITVPLWGAINDGQFGISLFGTSVGAFLVMGFLIAFFKKGESK
jgi:electron transport complex protein RnfE